MNKKRVLIIGGDSGLSKSLSLYFLLNNIDVTSTTRKKNDKMRVYLNLKNENLNLTVFLFEIIFCIIDDNNYLFI